MQDQFDVRSDPDLFLKSTPTPLILDEVQYVPELLAAIKRWVDEKPQPGQFILTGSQNFSVLKNIAESLAGRVGILHLSGMTALEQYGQTSLNSWLSAWLAQDISALQKGQLIPDVSVHRAIWRGGYPGTINLPDDLMADYFSSYVQTYIERDIRSISEIHNLQLFYRFVSLQAALTSQEINHAQMGRELGIAMTTAQHWVGHLNNTYLWHEINNYSGNSIKRLIKKPKGYLADTGLACHLMRISSIEALLGHPNLGALFETLCVNEIMSMSNLLTTQPGFYHWRTSSGVEVDLILEIDGTLFPIEFKCRTSVGKRDAKGIDAFRETYEGTCKIAPGLVIYAGDYFMKISETTYALPWNWVV